jgi:enhancing lycopene biosynthesis protein 2
MAKTVGVVLSGCGVFDGAEIHEAVLTLYFLARAGARAVCFAPDVPQLHVIDHRTRDVAPRESRNVLVESARIARGDIRDLAAARAGELDALILPGGSGAAKNLSDFASAREHAKVRPELARLLDEVHAAGKPIGAICIAPAVLAAWLRGSGKHASLTIGDEAGTAATLEAMGARHVACRADRIVVDEPLKLVTTPAYMTARDLAEAGAGIERLVARVLDLAGG